VAASDFGDIGMLRDSIASSKSRRKLRNLDLDMPLSRSLCLFEDPFRRLGVEIVFAAVRAGFGWHGPDDGNGAWTLQCHGRKARGSPALPANRALHGAFLVLKSGDQRAGSGT
jgi:hypothetical protein